MRAQKDIAIAAKASGDDAARREAQAKINALQERYESISEKAGLNTESKRMTVAGFRPVKVDSNLTYIRDDAKIKASSGLPKILKGLPDDTVKSTAIVEFPNLNGVVPMGANIRSIIVMAGQGTSTPIHDLQRLYTSYPKYGNASDWQKKSGTVTTENFSYEIHWYEANGEMPKDEIKIKRVKRVK